MRDEPLTESFKINKENKIKFGDRFASVWKKWLDFQGHREYWDIEKLRDEPFEKSLERCEEIVKLKKTGQPTLDDDYYFRVLRAKAIKEGIISK